MCFCTRRNFLFGASFAAGSLISSGAQAQPYPLMCSYGGDTRYGQGLAPGSVRAVREVTAICRAIEYPLPIAVYVGGVPNASATIIGGYQAIVYNRQFLASLFRCNEVAAASVLAHEVGHHASGDTWIYGRLKHPWGRELGADWVSGFAMARLGVGLDDSLSGIQCAFGEFGPPPSPSHPDGSRRLDAIEQGWLAA